MNIRISLVVSMFAAICTANASAQTTDEKKFFINKADLSDLGCDVKSDSGIYIKRMGEKILSFSDKSGCATKVTTTITLLEYSKETAEQLWAGLETDMQRRVKQCKCQPTRHKGSIGERSEYFVFPADNKARGFLYVAQDRGWLYRVDVRSDEPSVTPELEKRISEKLDQLVVSLSATP